MKTIPWLCGTLALCLLGPVGCKKEPAQDASQEFYGVRVDWLKLDSSFANAGPDVQNSVTAVKHALRYGLFAQALAELEKLARHPSLTEDQKKLVRDLTEQTKQVIAKRPPPAP